MRLETLPLPEDTPLSFKALNIGTFALLALIGLRLVIGWHFLDEGRGKLLSGGFSCAPFFQQSKGPLAPFIHSWTGYQSPQRWLDREASERHWSGYRDRVAQRFRFDEKQTKRASEILDQHVRLLRGHFRARDDDITKFLNSHLAIERAAADPALAELPSLSIHADRNQSELAEMSADLVSPVRGYWQSLELQLHHLLTDEQKQQAELPISGVRGFLSTATIDRIVPFFTLAVGALLLIGLFSRMASLAGAAFLLMVIATQPPWMAGTTPVHSQIIEMCGLLVIAGTGAGRIAGLDYFLRTWRKPRTINA